MSKNYNYKPVLYISSFPKLDSLHQRRKMFAVHVEWYDNCQENTNTGHL